MIEGRGGGGKGKILLIWLTEGRGGVGCGGEGEGDSPLFLSAKMGIACHPSPFMKRAARCQKKYYTAYLSHIQGASTVFIYTVYKYEVNSARGGNRKPVAGFFVINNKLSV